MGCTLQIAPPFPAVSVRGRQEAEAEANGADAIRECLAVRAERGLPATVTMREVKVAV